MLFTIIVYIVVR